MEYLEFQHALYTLQSKLFSLKRKVHDICGFVFADGINIYSKSSGPTHVSSSSSVDSLSSGCTKVLTPGKKETLLTTFVFGHSCTKEAWALLVAKNFKL